MSTDERDMDLIFAKNGRAIGRTGGIPLDQLGLTALGCYHAFETLVEGGFVDGLESVEGATMTIEGFGNVGSALARFVSQAGVKIVAVSDLVNSELDYGGVVYHPEGLDLAKLLALRDAGMSVVDTDQPGVEIKRGRAALKHIFEIAADVVVPAARTNSVELETAKKMSTKLVLEAANSPLTREAEELLHANGVVCAVDYIVNCGGVIGGAEAWAEMQHPLGSLRIPNCVARIVKAVGANIPAIYSHSRESGMTPREAAVEIVKPRIA
jgi:glutamate dehydrogenase/leucine dehydrogenase